jgi:hypothetical protein
MKISLLLGIFLFVSALSAHADNKTYRLYVDTAPKDAHVIIWNIKPGFRQGMSLLNGEYDIEVRKPGYHSERRKIRLKGKDRRLSFNLKAKTYRLYVRTDPPGARISLAGEKNDFIQGTPVSAGRHRLQVSHPGYQTVRQNIEVSDRNLTVTVKLAALPAAKPKLPPAIQAFNATGAPLRLQSQPANADIWLLAFNQPYSPGMLLAPGNYEVVISAAGYTPRRLWARAGQDGATETVILAETGLASYCYAGRVHDGGNAHDYRIELRYDAQHASGVYRHSRAPDGFIFEHLHFQGNRQGPLLEVSGLSQGATRHLKMYLIDDHIQIQAGQHWLNLPPVSCLPH